MIKLKQDNNRWKHGTPVTSSAQKFIIPVPNFQDGEPLIYPKDYPEDADPAIAGKSVPNAGKPITDWEGKSIGSSGIIFFNYKDKCYQAVQGDGTGVIIVNLVTKIQAKKLCDKINEFGSNPDKLSYKQINDVLQYAKKKLGLDDVYNSNIKFVGSKMSKVTEDTPYPNYGLHKRDDRDICYSTYISGSSSFQGPAATPQEFSNGAVILKQGDDVRLIQTEEFKQSYTHLNGNKIQTVESEITNYTLNTRMLDTSAEHTVPAPRELS